MYPVLKLMHMLNFLDTFSVGVTTAEKPNHLLPFVMLFTKYSDIVQL